jgi:CheY-like chemotaxis protein
MDEAGRTPEVLNYLMDEANNLAVIFASPAEPAATRGDSTAPPPLRAKTASPELRDWIKSCNNRITTFRTQSPSQDTTPDSRRILLEQFPKSLHFSIGALFEFASRLGKFENLALANRIDAETQSLVSGLLYYQQHLQQHPANTTNIRPPAPQPAYTRSESEATWICYEDIIRHCNRKRAINVALNSADSTLLPIPTLVIRLIIQNVLFAVLGDNLAASPVDIRISNEKLRDKDYFCLALPSQGNPLANVLGTNCQSRRDPRTFVFEGSGIGHIIAAKLAELIAGDIAITSNAEGRSQVQIMLPLQQRKVAEPEPTLFAQTVRHASGADEFSVLYIEDMHSHAMLVKQIFERMSNFELLLAPTAHAGLDLARCCRPDLILLDMELPDMKGLDVYRELQAHAETAGIPVFAISASAMPDQVNQALSLGIKQYLTKPFSYKELMRMLQEQQQVKTQGLRPAQ